MYFAIPAKDRATAGALSQYATPSAQVSDGRMYTVLPVLIFFERLRRCHAQGFLKIASFSLSVADIYSYFCYLFGWDKMDCMLR